jgi:integrase
MSVAGVAAMPVASGESLPNVPSMFAPLTHDRPSDPMRLSLWWVAPWEDVPASAWLLAFDRYLQQRTGASAQPLSWLIREYADLASTAEARLERMQSGRTLAQGLQRLDPAITPPILDKMVIREALRHRRRPYIYTEEQVRSLLAAALDMPSPRAPLRPLTLYTMLVLGYCAGLRVGEFTRLALADFRLDDGTIEIRNTKFFKSRRLPLTASVVADLERYVAARQQAGASQEPAAALFWNEQGGRGYTVVTAQHLLTDVMDRKILQRTPIAAMARARNGLATRTDSRVLAVSLYGRTLFCLEHAAKRHVAQIGEGVCVR